MTSRVCRVCGGSLAGKRADAITCSNACRQARARQRDQVRRDGDKALDMIYYLLVERAEGEFPRLAEKKLNAVQDYLAKYMI